MNHCFGRQPDVPAIRSWGARAIIQRSHDIDIPFDRQSYHGDREGSGSFIDWVNRSFIPALDQKTVAHLNKVQQEVFSLDSPDGKYHGEACCMGSHGYLYIGCWEKE